MGLKVFSSHAEATTLSSYLCQRSSALWRFASRAMRSSPYSYFIARKQNSPNQWPFPAPNAIIPHADRPGAGGHFKKHNSGGEAITYCQET